ncbi:hypothetical protein Tco_0494729 [Tanacetum coccineum]
MADTERHGLRRIFIAIAIPTYSEEESSRHYSVVTPETCGLTQSKSSVEELVPTPSESADLSDDERECDVPVNDESSLNFLLLLSNLSIDS